MAYRIDIAEPLADGLRRIAMEQLRSAIGNLHLPAEQRMIGVHRCRKCLKKTRALLRMVRKEIGDDLYRIENRSLRDIAAELSAMRDADVMVDTLTALGEWAGDRLDIADIVPFRHALLESQASLARSTTADGGEIERTIEHLESALERARHWPIERNRFVVVEGGIGRTYRAGRRGYARVLEDPTGENIHEWRKQVKYLWYMTRIIQKALARRFGNLVGELDRLAGLLGADRDLELLHAATVASSSIPTDSRLAGMIELRREELQEEAKSLGSRLYNPTPKSFTRAIRSEWEAWRPDPRPGRYDLMERSIH
jgi:CHAD domain-containing protein